jgi:hypothetical protein
MGGGVATSQPMWCYRDSTGSVEYMSPPTGVVYYGADPWVFDWTVFRTPAGDVQGFLICQGDPIYGLSTSDTLIGAPTGDYFVALQVSGLGPLTLEVRACCLEVRVDQPP